MNNEQKKQVSFKNFKRRTWNFNPVERVVKSKKAYDKKKERQKRYHDGDK